MTINELLLELDYPKDIEQAVRSKLVKDERQLIKIADTAYDGDDFDFLLCKRMPLTRLAVITLLLMQKYSEYRARGISHGIIIDTFRDVSLRAALYVRKTGRVGLSKDDVIWFRHIIHIHIFKIGALQFQPFEMLYLDKETIGDEYMTFHQEQKTRLPNGSAVINCHIPCGADLSRRAVEQALTDATAFFQTHFAEVRYQAFLCYSWLLYPPMICNLPKQSKIRQFAEQFSVIGLCSDSKQAMENLFENGKPGALPNATSIQKMAVDNPELFGFACGVIEI